MDGNISKNILSDYISQKIFDETYDYDYGSGLSMPLKYMEVNVIGISNITSIKIGKLNHPDNNFKNYWTAIKIRGVEPSIVSPFGTIEMVSDFIANNIGKNLIWIDTQIRNDPFEWDYITGSTVQ
jgi:hypothetical protein